MDNDVFARLPYGVYLIGDDGGIDRYESREAARKAAIDCSDDGIGCRIVIVEERYDAMPQPDDNKGIYRPATLGRPLEGGRAA